MSLFLSFITQQHSGWIVYLNWIVYYSLHVLRIKSHNNTFHQRSTGLVSSRFSPANGRQHCRLSICWVFENQNQKQIQITIKIMRWACLVNGQKAFTIRCDFSLLFIFFKYRRRQNCFNINVAGVAHDDQLFYSFKAGPADDSLFNWPERLD